MRFLSALVYLLLKRLDEPQLRLVHARITERLRSLHHTREQATLVQFQTGDAVTFDHHGERHVGVVCHRNRRTVSVREENGKHWNVSPGFLTKSDTSEPPAAISE